MAVTNDFPKVTVMKNLTIARRLAYSFALIVALTAVTAVIFVAKLRGIRQEVASVSEDSIPSILIVNKMEKNALTYRILTSQHVLAQSDAEKKNIDRQCDALEQTIRQEIKDYVPYVTTDQERALQTKIEPTLNAFLDVAKRIRALSLANKTQDALALLKGDGTTTYAAFQAAVNACETFNDTAGKQHASNVDTSVAHSLSMTIILAVAVFVAASLAGVLLTRTINARLRRVADALSDGAGQVAAAAGQVSSASQSLAEGASEQAASLEETSASLEEISSMVKRNAENSQVVYQFEMRIVGAFGWHTLRA